MSSDMREFGQSGDSAPWMTLVQGRLLADERIPPIGVQALERWESK
jgi:hypothetical protein